MTKAQRYFMEIKDKRVAFIGTGVSHLELIKLFLSKGIRCVVCDKKTEDEFDELIYEELSAKGCEFSLGEHYLDIIFNCDIVISKLHEYIILSCNFFCFSDFIICY